MTDQANKIRFFEKIFLVANISLDIVFGMPFFILSDADIDFQKRELCWKFYTIEEALSTTKRVKLVKKKEFTAAAFDPGNEIFVVYVAFLESFSNNSKSDVHPFCRA